MSRLSLHCSRVAVGDAGVPCASIRSRSNSGLSSSQAVQHAQNPVRCTRYSLRLFQHRLTSLSIRVFKRSNPSIFQGQDRARTRDPRPPAKVF
jgi:hypothetical protein